jgi:transcriptional regulator with XRE-family HTH domain
VPRDWWRGTVLKKVRQRRKLTQAVLAKRVGVHQVTIARLESGTRRPSMAMLQRLSKALGVPVTALLE